MCELIFYDNYRLQLSHMYPMANSMWVVILNSSIHDFFYATNLPFNTEIIVAQIKNYDYVNFLEVYRVDKDYPMRVVNFGNWTRTGGLQVLPGIIYTRRSDLEGKLFKAGFIQVRTSENGDVVKLNNNVFHSLFRMAHCPLSKMDIGTGTLRKCGKNCLS